MNQVEQIREIAHARGRQLDLPYSGALLPQEAHCLQQQLPEAVLVDVRSAAEWQFVGLAPGSVCIEWRSFPGMTPRSDFIQELQRQVDKSAVLMFICRSGVRSDETARLAAEAGFGEIYNVLEGFEGDKDEHGQRGRKGGWKARGLPWRQG